MIDSERELISNRINIACSAGLSVGLMPDGTAVVTIACEQALCLGKKMARKGKGKGEREPFRFSLSLPRSTKGLFTGYCHHFCLNGKYS